MAKRSLQASSVGIHLTKRAFALKGWTQDNLAGEVNLKTRQPIWRLFTGQPVDRQVFMDVCQILDLDWREIANQSPADFPELGEGRGTSLSTITELVAEVRSQHRDAIQQRCGILQLLNVHHPVNLDDIHIDIPVAVAVASQQWGDLTALNTLDPTKAAQVGKAAAEPSPMSGMQAVETYNKLRLLGQPGVGKTLCLKHLALQCNRGELAADCVPIFITLRAFAAAARGHVHLSLFAYLQMTFVTSGLADTLTLETLLQTGRILLLVDGLDEVPQADITPVMNKIRRFADQYHRNRFVVACRTAAQNLTLRGFTDVEIAPLTLAQIRTAAEKWFATLTPPGIPSAPNPAQQLMQQLELPENWQVRQLVSTPLFLHLACWLLSGNAARLAPPTRFYQQGYALLLGKWDAANGIERDEIYPGFGLPHTMRLLSHLAAIAVEQQQPCFERHRLETVIAAHLQDSTALTLEPEELQLASEMILNVIAVQTGLLIERARDIFSFSHLAFQTYLTARTIVCGD